MKNTALSKLDIKRANTKKEFLKTAWKQKELQLFVLIPLMFVIVFSYVPMFGLILAFKNFSFRLGVWGSEWIGLGNFKEFVSSSFFVVVMKNTICISLLKILFCFPIPIILAIMLTELKSVKGRNLVQGISYLPHFMSWIICFGALMVVFDRDTGILNQILLGLGIIKEPKIYLGDADLFWPILIITENWKEAGWGSLIYVATILGIDPQLSEAAEIDGANRWRRIQHITLPHLLPVVSVLFIMSVGNILNAGFDQIFVMSNSLVADKGRIIDMYVYEVGLKQARYDFATAVGLFKSIIGFILVWSANRFAAKFEMEMF